MPRSGDRSAADGGSHGGAWRPYRAGVSILDQGVVVDILPSTVAEMEANAGDLFAAHYDEIARNKRVMRLSPDWLRYKALEQSGSLLLLAAWAGDCIIGYSASFVVTHLHYSELLYCHNDVLFVAKEYRRGRLGLGLIRATEREAKKRGAQMVSWHAKQGTALEALMPRLGYGVQDIIYSREV